MLNLYDTLGDALIDLTSRGSENGPGIAHMFGIVVGSSSHRSAVTSVLRKLPGGINSYGHGRIAVEVLRMVEKDLKRYEIN